MALPEITPEITLSPVSFSELPGWDGDDHAVAFAAFRRSAKRLLARAADGAIKGPASPPDLLAACEAALAAGAGQGGAASKAFFEARFAPHRVLHAAPRGLLTGYYEPRVPGAREPTGAMRAPIYRRPSDLANMVDETERGAKSGGFTHMRRAASGLEPYFTRAEIEQGALAGLGLEFFYFADPVDVFFMQVQGSGLVELPDGGEARVTYDGKNGYPYTSIGKYVIDAGLMSREEMSLAGLQAWLRADPARGREVMWKNQSYVFFRELLGEEAGAPRGSFEIPLSTGRSLAVDTRHHAIGSPVYVSAPDLTHAGGESGFQRLMIAQDVGSAIVGPERGDIYFGSGQAAWDLASVTQHPGNFFVLLPRAQG